MKLLLLTMLFLSGALISNAQSHRDESSQKHSTHHTKKHKKHHKKKAKHHSHDSRHTFVMTRPESIV